MATVHTNRKSGFVFRAGVQRRQTLWLQSVMAQTTIAAASMATLIGSLNAAALALRPFTIVRTRGMVNIRSDQTSVSEDYSAAIGLAVVTDQVVAAGVASVPTPTTDSASDWFVYQLMSGELQVTSDIGRLLFVNETVQIDSRSMRKVDLGEDIITVVESTALSSGVIIDSFVRVLIKLH